MTLTSFQNAVQNINYHYYTDLIKQDEMGDTKKEYKIIVGKPEGRRTWET
jgi:hypothetical protein